MVWASDERIEIGSFCSIGERVVIFGGGEHRTDWVSTYPFAEVFDLKDKKIIGHPSSKGPTTIGHDVWLGFQSTILSGVTIGTGAVIGANTLVSKDVPPYAVVVGNPGKVVRFRFRAELINDLLEIAWWNWPLNEILKNADVLSSPDSEGAINHLKRVKENIKA
jgi:acetyltransferase-like isoleucine patch superfamily enzyme